jgi:hypothetical protein
MARIRVITVDSGRIEAGAPIPFEAELVAVSDMSQPPSGYPSFIKFPPETVVGEYAELAELVARFRADPPTGHIAFGISSSALLVSAPMAEAVEIAMEQGVDADIVVNPHVIEVDA